MGPGSLGGTPYCASRILGAAGEIEQLSAEFPTMTSQLLAVRDWLKGFGVTHVAMEAAGVYWKPVYYVLEDDFELLLPPLAARTAHTARL